MEPVSFLFGYFVYIFLVAAMPITVFTGGKSLALSNFLMCMAAASDWFLKVQSRFL